MNFQEKNLSWKKLLVKENLGEWCLEKPLTWLVPGTQGLR